MIISKLKITLIYQKENLTTNKYKNLSNKNGTDHR